MMPFSHLFFLLVVLPLVNQAYAQGQLRQPYFQIGYYGVLGTHPGLKLGVQFPLATLNRQRRDEQLNQVLAGASIIWYYHRRNHTGLALQAELGFRQRVAGGLNKAIFFGAGYLRKVLPRRVYDVDGGEQLLVRSGYSSGHFLKTISIGFGRQLKNDIDQDFWMIQPTLMHVKPLNVGTTLNFALDAGLHFN